MLISKFRASALMLALMFSVFATGQTTQWRDIHKVKKGETLFGLAKSYAISIQDLIDANPEMKTPGYELKKGDWVFVPFAKKDDVPASSLQQVQPKQTPPAGSQQPQTVKPAVQAQGTATTATKADGTVRVGVMLPLHNENGDGKRMVEYYRGILMALNKLSEEGIRTEVKAWNVPIDADIRTTLQEKGVTDLNLIIGPLYSNMVRPLADFCKANNIKLLIPFSISGNDVASCPNIYQVYQSPEEVTAKSIAAFMERFPGHHPVFIDCNDPGSGKGVFTTGLRKQLDIAKRDYNLTNLNTPVAAFDKAFSKIKPNIVVLNTARSPQLNKVFAKLDSLKAIQPGVAISMFGYNEWFMYQRYDLSNFYKYSVYIPTTYYYNAASAKTVAFEKLYFDTYGEQMNSGALPRFALTGYDHAMFFIRGMSKNPATFSAAAAQVDYKPLQTRLNFVRLGQGGYKNVNFQLVHFKSDQTLESITY